MAVNGKPVLPSRLWGIAPLPEATVVSFSPPTNAAPTSSTLSKFTSMRDPQSKKADRRQILVLVAICLFLYFFMLGARALWDHDEGIHAAMARNMVETGDWVTPTFNGEGFYDKPALFNWLGALSFEALGFTELAARLPSAVLGLASVLLTFLLGRRLFGSTVGFLGGLILATSGLFMVLSRAVQYDIVLTFFTTLSLFLFYSGVVDEKHRRHYFLSFYVAAAFAVLAKGPLGLVIPALVIGPYLLLTRRLGLLREMQIGWGALIVVAIASPWYILMGLRNEDFLSHFFLGQNVGYFLSPESRHPEPFYFYLLVLPGLLFPWTAFLPLAIYRPLRDPQSRSRDPIRFLLVWVIVIFVFFSLSVSKLETYLLPLFPAVALLIALLWEKLLTTRNEGLRRGLFWFHLPIVAISLASVVYVWLYPPLEKSLRYGIDQKVLLAFVLPIAGFLTASLWLLWSRRYAACLAALVGVMVSGLVVFTTVFAPATDPYRSTKDLALELDPRLPPGEEIAFFSRLRDSALFYTGRGAVVFKDPQELDRYFASEGRAFCLVEDRYLSKLDEIADRFTVVDKVGNKVLLSDQPD
jgi:4-amino-4-deoxy-L-arabinose transferase-like glycosyltransferase